MFTVDKPVVLASSSPRRKELMAFLVPSFSVVASGADESVDFPCTASQLVEHIASRKAAHVVGSVPAGSLVIGADTVVALGGTVLGKPESVDDARRMLYLLQGNTHTVHTGVCVLDTETGRSLVRSEATDVTFALMDRDEIEEYLATGESMDKAGAYGIQGTCNRYIAGIKGDFYNVMGLPVRLLYEMLKEMK